MKRMHASRDVIIRTVAWNEAVAFYETLLGLLVTHASERIKGFETGSFRLYVEDGVDHGPVFDFLVPDVQAEKQRLLAAGCSLVEEDATVPRCYLRDLFGLVFNLGRDDGDGGS